MRVLDVGGGNGDVSILAAPHLGSRAVLPPVDTLAFEQVEEALRGGILRAASHGSKRLEISPSAVRAPHVAVAVADR
jgi:hypothetical protein